MTKKDGEINEPVNITDLILNPPATNPLFWEGKKYQKRAPKSFKYMYPSPMVLQRLTVRILRLINLLTEISNVRISGLTAEGNWIDIRLSSLASGFSYDETVCKLQTDFHFEDKEYKKFPHKAKVSSWKSEDNQTQKDHITRIKQFLDELPPVNFKDLSKDKGLFDFG
jgi:hypothetical protein